LQGLKGFDRETFEAVHSSGEQITSIRLNPSKQTEIRYSTTPIPWTGQGFYLAHRPSFTFDPLFHAGCYYVQEASSMFLEQAMKQTVDLAKPLKVLDLCAAPGGKSTHIQSLISAQSLLVSNEVIRSRATILKDNIIKWGSANVVVTNNDPKDFARLAGYFDVIIVDAPCSGSGLFRKDPETVSEWSEHNVQLCAQRQQRILADIWPALKKDGILIYSTCSYSMQEDEEILDWLKNDFPATPLTLTVSPECGITISGTGYRFWPDKIKGEGFFLACFQKSEGVSSMPPKIKKKAEPISSKERVIINNWVKQDGFSFIKNAETVYAWPYNLHDDFNLLLNHLRVVYSGVLAGNLVRDKLLPDHALAMSTILADKVSKIDLTEEEAIKYLQRKELKLDTVIRGWQLAVFKNQPLGWVNILPNRINNYYPKELRILKDF
jgi:16S rRNA C967 or C1407 C5-methylase (RsmB/RsmF family)/NOL1/NOP2/fmu family ribosome biogenesis protein